MLKTYYSHMIQKLDITLLAFMHNIHHDIEQFYSQKFLQIYDFPDSMKTKVFMIIDEI